jgi:hypothetical protein
VFRILLFVLRISVLVSIRLHVSSQGFFDRRLASDAAVVTPFETDDIKDTFV